MRAEFFLALALAASPAAARPRAVPPDAAALLIRALSAPATGFMALGRVQTFLPGRKPKGLGVTTYVLPDGRRRVEVRKSPRRPPETVLVDDGRRRLLSWPRLGSAWTAETGNAPAEEQAARLRALFSVTVTTGGHVAKRKTWRLNLAAPDGRVRRSLWVDRETGLLLKRETYRLDGTLMRRERTTKLAGLPRDVSSFESSPPDGAAVSPVGGPRGSGPSLSRPPQWLPDGFLPLETRSEPGGVRAVYGDGLLSFAVRETGDASDPVESTSREVALKDGVKAVLFMGPDRLTLIRRTGGRVYSISGDLAEDDLVRVAESIR